MLAVARYYLAGASVGDYAIFAGGISSSAPVTNADAYNMSLTKVTATALSLARYSLNGAATADYALFAGGMIANQTRYDRVDAYSRTLVRSTPTTLSVTRNDAGATNCGV